MKIIPITLLPMIRIIVLAEFRDAVSQLRGFQQQQLDDEEADLCLITLLRPQH